MFYRNSLSTLWTGSVPFLGHQKAHWSLPKQSTCGLWMKAHDRVPSGTWRRVTALNGGVEHLRMFMFTREGRTDHGTDRLGQQSELKGAGWSGSGIWPGCKIHILTSNKTGAGYLPVGMNLISVPQSTYISPFYEMKDFWAKSPLGACCGTAPLQVILH